VTLTEDQSEALKKLEVFRPSPSTAFLLEGGAGVGKTFLLGEIVKALDGIVCVAAPTHKAINVLRKKLDAFGVSWCQGFDDYTYNGSDVITGTTAQLLGIAPVITEDQSTEMKFGKTGKGILSKVMPETVIIDEVSMLGKHDFMALREVLKKAGSKLLAVGDAGQLPPVKQEQIPFPNFVNRAPLRQIVRQAEGSAIVTLAWAIRDGNDWTKIAGNGVRRTSSLGDAFLEAVQIPGERREEDREVYIAYVNRKVNEVQERACKKLYGHGRLAFAPGELVLAETNLYRSKILMCANQDELIVDSFMEDEKDEIGTPVVMHHVSDRRKGKFTATYVPPEDLKNPEHPYRVELRRRELLAQELQEKMRSTSGFAKEDVNARRKRAWAAFFEWRDQKIISFRHPFAITSHKSQGSTYRQVFADTGDLGRFSSQALYVAVTRPREELVIPE
jgi:exodeoxyribonuclease-5